MTNDRRTSPPPGSDTNGSSRSEPGLQHRMHREARRISSQHQQLDVFFGRVTEALQRESLRATRIAFTRFADALEAHLGLEDGVFFPALRGLDPSLTDELAALAREHTGLRNSLETVTDLLAKGSIESLRRELATLADDISSHEEREERLLQQIQKTTTPSTHAGQAGMPPGTGTPGDETG